MEYDPGSYEVQDDPFPVYRWLRDEAPIHRDDARGFYALSRFDDVHAALADAATYSSADGIQLEVTAETLGIQTEILLNMDPPEHTRRRQLVSRGFTPRRVAALEATIRATCAELLDDLVARGGGDLVTDYAATVPAAVIASITGLDDDDHVALRDLTDRMNHREPGSITQGPDADAAGVELYRLFAGVVARRRAEPRDDMASALLAATITEADGSTSRLSDLQLVLFDMLLAVAGYETTANVIGNLVVALERDRSQRQLLLDDPELAGAAVEEALRHDGSTHYLKRITTTEVTWHGEVVPAGSRVLLVLGAANRDGREFDDPDRFDVQRVAHRHLAFGHGIHFCLGASLARLEARIAIEEVLRRAPGYEVDLGGLRRKHSSNFRGYAAVPVSV